MKKCKNFLIACVCMTMAVSFGINVNAEGDADAKKDESVFVVLNADGSVNETTVSEWLHSDSGISAIEDISYLTDIVNTKDDIEPSISGDTIKWDTTGNDVYYTGTSSKALPIKVKISYALDGQEMKAEDIVGKSGKLSITVHVINETRETQVINGKSEQVSVLFPYMVMSDLNTEKYSNVKAEGGITLNEGKNQIVGFVSISGMESALDSVDLDQVQKIKDKVKDTFVIEADVENAEIPSIMITSIATDALDTSDVDTSDLDKVTDGIGELKDATQTILEGTKTLADSNAQLNDKMGEFQNKYGEFSDGVTRAKDGSTSLKNGIEKTKTGAEQLNEGLQQLQDGLNQAINETSEQQIQAISKQLTDASAQLTEASTLMTGLGTLVNSLGALPETVAGGISDAKNNADIKSGLDNAVANGTAQGVTTATDTIKGGSTAGLAAAICGNLADKVIVSEDASANSSVEGGPYYTKSTGDDGSDVYTEVTPTVNQSIESQSTATLNNEACVATVQAYLDAQMTANGTGTIADGILQGATSGATQGAEAALYGYTNAEGSTIPGIIDSIAYGAQTNMQSKLDEMNVSETLETANTTISNMQTLITTFQGTIGQMSTLTGSLPTMKTAVVKLHAGATELVNGESQLVDGAGTLESGLTDLQNASNTISDAINQFKDATNQLADGSKKLDDGVQEFSSDGIDKLSNEVNDAIDGLNEVLDILRASDTKTKEYSNYAGAPEGVDTTVKFIMKTSAVTIPDTTIEKGSSSSTTVNVEESKGDTVQKVTVLEKIKGLFQ